MKLKKIMSTLLALMLAVSLMTTLTIFSQDISETDTTTVATETGETLIEGTTTEISETTEPSDITSETTLPNYEEYDIFFLIYDTLGYEASDVLDPTPYVKETEVTITSAIIYKEGYINYAWTDGEIIYPNGSVITIPDHNVTLTPLFHKIYKVTYRAGDYDGITGNTQVSFSRHETGVFDLADSTRFSRSGYSLTHWLDIETNEKYKPISQYKMPSRDLILEAVWEPITYKIMFSSNTPIRESFNVAGTYGTEITLPLNRFKYEGHKFIGWTYGSKLYKAGDKFTVPAVMPGLNLSLKATWEALDGEDEPNNNVFNYMALKQQIGKDEVTAESIKQSKAFLLNCKD
ncbi:MAG: hypothetical protein GX365_00030 [Clostridiales bacterium]|nr:hypothetical protein [Clostridiales bacterium]